MMLLAHISISAGRHLLMPYKEFAETCRICEIQIQCYLGYGGRSACEPETGFHNKQSVDMILYCLRGNPFYNP